MSTHDNWEPDDYGLVPRDFLSLIPTEFDLDRQLEIIQAIFHRNRKTSGETIKEIESIKEAANRLQGSAADQAVEDYGTMVYWAIYEDAAHGMSAIAMLAPLYERVLHGCLALIGGTYHQQHLPNPTHVRWTGGSDYRWDCRYFWPGTKWKKDVYLGSKQLLEALDLLSVLPADFLPVYSVVVAYRNKMFHHGLEWPIAERKSFKGRIVSEGWSADWFSCSQSGNDPWMVSLTDQFVDRCIALLLALADLLGGYVRTKASESTI
jgi:hypothetical protein